MEQNGGDEGLHEPKHQQQQQHHHHLHQEHFAASMGVQSDEALAAFNVGQGIAVPPAARLGPPAVSSATPGGKYKKAPDAPKRFKSAFIIFSAEKHKEIKEDLAKQGRSEKTTDIAKLVSEAWREMPPDEKEIWEKKARQDKARYEVEKAMYKGPWKIPANRRTPKDPTAPKRPMSAFLAFSNKRRAALKRQNPDATNADLSKMLSKTWREAPDDLRQKYTDEEAELRAQYKIEMAKWRKKVAEEKKAERKEREAIALQAAEARQVDVHDGIVPLGADVTHRGPAPPMAMNPEMSASGMPGGHMGLYMNPYVMQGAPPQPGAPATNGAPGGAPPMGDLNSFTFQPPPGSNPYQFMGGAFGPQSLFGPPAQQQIISQLLSPSGQQMMQNVASSAPGGAPNPASMGNSVGAPGSLGGMYGQGGIQHNQVGMALPPPAAPASGSGTAMPPGVMQGAPGPGIGYGGGMVGHEGMYQMQPPDQQQAPAPQDQSPNQASGHTAGQDQQHSVEQQQNQHVMQQQNQHVMQQQASQQQQQQQANAMRQASQQHQYNEQHSQQGMEMVQNQYHQLQQQQYHQPDQNQQHVMEMIHNQTHAMQQATQQHAMELIQNQTHAMQQSTQQTNHAGQAQQRALEMMQNQGHAMQQSTKQNHMLQQSLQQNHHSDESQQNSNGASDLQQTQQTHQSGQDKQQRLDMAQHHFLKHPSEQNSYSGQNGMPGMEMIQNRAQTLQQPPHLSQYTEQRHGVEMAPNQGHQLQQRQSEQSHQLGMGMVPNQTHTLQQPTQQTYHAGRNQVMEMVQNQMNAMQQSSDQCQQDVIDMVQNQANALQQPPQHNHQGQNQRQSMEMIQNPNHAYQQARFSEPSQQHVMEMMQNQSFEMHQSQQQQQELPNEQNTPPASLESPPQPQDQPSANLVVAKDQQNPIVQAREDSIDQSGSQTHDAEQNQQQEFQMDSSQEGHCEPSEQQLPELKQQHTLDNSHQVSDQPQESMLGAGSSNKALAVTSGDGITGLASVNINIAPGSEFAEAATSENPPLGDDVDEIQEKAVPGEMKAEDEGAE